MKIKMTDYQFEIAKGLQKDAKERFEEEHDRHCGIFISPINHFALFNSFLQEIVESNGIIIPPDTVLAYTSDGYIID